MNADIIMATLEQVANFGDPQERVYARLFEINPEFEPLFALDKSGIVRGTMLQTSLDCIVGFAEQQETARNVIHAARLHHSGYGVPDNKVDNMFVAIRDTFRDILDERWTPEMEAEWTSLLTELSSSR